MPPHSSEIDSIILKQLNAFSVPDAWNEETFKPFLTFTELLRRTRTHRTTLTRHLNKMVGWGLVIRYSSGESDPKLKLARDNPVFYRLNPETSGELKRHSVQDLDGNRENYPKEYHKLTSNKRLGKVPKSLMTQVSLPLEVEPSK